MKLGPEQVQQIILFDWIRNNKLDDFIFHVANERRCSPQHGAVLKRMGVMAGVADVIVARASRSWNGMFLEMKSENGRISPAQSKFMASMHREGYATLVAYSGQEAIYHIQDYLCMPIG